MNCPLQLHLDAGHLGTLSVAARQVDSSQERNSWNITLEAGPNGFEGSLSLTASLPATGEVPWFLFPGFFYKQGREDASRRYPQLGVDDWENWTSSTWDFALDRGASPVLLSHHANRWTGMDWSPHYEVTDGENSPVAWGDSEPQIGCGFSWNESRGELRLNLPANERPRSYTRHCHDSATHKILRLSAGQKLVFQVAWWDIEGGAHGYAPILKKVREQLHDTHPPAQPVESGLLARSSAHGLLAWHWEDTRGTTVYSVPFDRTAESISNTKGTTLCWHAESIGFAGGFPVAFGLLWHGLHNNAPRSREVAERLIERFCREAQTPWGFFRTSYHPGRATTPNGEFDNPAPVGVANNDPTGATPFYGSWWIEDQSLIHARTTADASLYLARCLTLLTPHHPRYEEWRAVLRRTLEAALSVQDEEGNFGQLYDVVNHKVAERKGDGGLLWIVAMHHAEPLFAEDDAFQRELRESMRRAGDFYAADVEAAWIYGGPEDVALSPTSEDGYNAVMAYAALHRREGEDKYLELLRMSADWTLTWRRTYNSRFSEKSALHSFRTVGGDYAGAQNNHLHIYGLCCLRDFQYLSQCCGDTYYAQRAEENWLFAAQLLCVENGQWNGQLGMCSEQFYVSQWSAWSPGWNPTAAHAQKGTICGFSAVWCVNMILLGLEQREESC